MLVLACDVLTRGTHNIIKLGHKPTTSKPAVSAAPPHALVAPDLKKFETVVVDARWSDWVLVTNLI